MPGADGTVNSIYEVTSVDRHFPGSKCFVGMCRFGIVPIQNLIDVGSGVEDARKFFGITYRRTVNRLNGEVVQRLPRSATGNLKSGKTTYNRAILPFWRWSHRRTQMPLERSLLHEPEYEPFPVCGGRLAEICAKLWCSKSSGFARLAAKAVEAIQTKRCSELGEREARMIENNPTNVSQPPSIWVARQLGHRPGISCPCRCPRTARHIATVIVGGEIPGRPIWETKYFVSQNQPRSHFFLWMEYETDFDTLCDPVCCVRRRGVTEQEAACYLLRAWWTNERAQSSENGPWFSDLKPGGLVPLDELERIVDDVWPDEES